MVDDEDCFSTGYTAVIACRLMADTSVCIGSRVRAWFHARAKCSTPGLNRLVVAVACKLLGLNQIKNAVYKASGTFGCALAKAGATELRVSYSANKALPDIRRMHWR